MVQAVAASAERVVMRFFKFTTISGIGLLVDIAIALFLHRTVGMPLWFSATLSFLIVGASNYVIFEFWLFRRNDSAMSLRRLIGVIASAALAGLSRISAILVFAPFFDVLVANGWVRDVLILLAGASVSLTINFLINSRIVFNQKM